MVAPADTRPAVAIIDGVRTPWVKAGAALAAAPMTDLARTAIQETLYRLNWPAGRVDQVVLGNVCMPADAANPARVAAMQAGVPRHVPALTVQRNCASGIEAVTQAATQVEAGRARIVLAGGAESMSTIPLLFPMETLTPMAKLMKARSIGQKLSAVLSLRLRHFVPVSGLMQGLTDPLCNMIMGKTAEVLAHEFAITRQQQDEFALRSHQRAVAAIEAGRFDDEIVTTYAGKKFTPVSRDVGPRPDQTMEALAKLRPIFDRRDGSVTVGNACQVTDGAAMLMIADANVAQAEGLPVLGYVRGYATAGLDPARMGLGPVYAIDRLLQEQGLSMGDIDLFEINEAFAAQVIACTRAMASDTFCQRELGRDSALGELDPDKLNVNGGAIALGHPVGATGTRIILDLLLEMRRRDAKLGVASLCVAGGQGAAVLLERR